MTEHLTDIPRNEADAYIKARGLEDPTHVYYWETTPGNRGPVRVYRFERPKKVNVIDPVAHRLIRKG